MNYKEYFDTITGEISQYIIRIDENGQETFIPNDQANSDWQQYQAWLSEGNEPEPAE